MDLLFHQTFDLGDIPRVFFLGFLECLLSTDNAIVIALLVRKLPYVQRKNALFLGIASAFIFRALGVLGISYLIRFFWIQLVGALYLYYLSIRFFTSPSKRSEVPTKIHAATFFKIVLLIELLDLAFALDSIVAGIAFITPFNLPGELNPKLWIIYLGGMIGLIGIRFAADLFNKLLDNFPRIEITAHLMIFWIALELTKDSLFTYFAIDKANYSYLTPLFWSVLIILFIIGLIGNKRKKAK